MTSEVHSIIRSYGATAAARVILAQIIEPLQAELATAKALLDEIAHLCENCRSLGDAQEIAYGNGDTSTGPGCEKCWVEDLKKQLAAAQTTEVERQEYIDDLTTEKAFFESELATLQDDKKQLVRVWHRKVKELEAKNERLKDFARPVIEQECWSLSPQDGGHLQELAEELGLIVPTIATADDVDDESDFEVGDRIYKFSDTLKE